MVKKLMLVLVAIAIAAFCIPAFAAVENVKVGGDIAVWGVYRNNFDFIKNEVPGFKDDNHWFMTSTRVYVSAQLAQNITAMVRLINERDWGANWTNTFTTTGTILPPAPAGLTVVTQGSVTIDTMAINLDLANVKIADLLTPGLSLIVGRQEYQMGEGQIIGSRYNAGNYPTAIAGRDLGLLKAFDAIRADYAVASIPLSVTGFLSKINETYGGFNGLTPGDTDLYAISLLWKPENYSLEPYWVLLHNGFGNSGVSRLDINTFGLRATAGIPAVKGLQLKGEYAKQSGKADGFATDGIGGNVEGWMGYLGAAYTFPVSMNPMIDAAYNFYTGANPGEDKVKQFVPLFPSNTAAVVGNVAYPSLVAAGASNLKVFKLGFGIEPLKKLALGLDWFNLNTDKDVAAGITSNSLGNEIDFNATYAYTEDLSFGFDYGYLISGKIQKDVANSTAATAGSETNAWQAIVSMKLGF